MQPDLATMTADRNRRLERTRKKRNLLLKSRGVDISWMHAEPIRQHICDLYDLGWSFEAITLLAGSPVSMQTVRHIARGDHSVVHRACLPLTNVPYSVHVPNFLPDELMVPAMGAHRRLDGLARMGWTYSDISEAANGLAITRMRGRQRILAATWRSVDRATRELSKGIGPSALTRGRAIKAGLIPLGAWDDIDCPDERPKGVAA